MRFGLALFAVTLVAPLAFAQEPPPPPPPDPSMQQPGTDVVAAQPGPGAILPNMLPTRIGGTVDARADYSNFNDELFSDIFLLGITLHGQYIWPENYGAYISMPYYYASDEESEQGFGNIELGGLYRLPQGPGNELLLRGAIALNTADNFGSIFAPYSQLSPRLYDAYTTGLDRTWFKAEGSYRHSQGNLHVGISAGADIPVGGDDGEGGSELDGILKAAASVGFQEPGSVGFGVGVTSLYALGVDGDDDNPIFGFNATLSVPVSPTMSIYGAFGLPDLENNIDEFDLFGIGAGLRAAIN
jgi:hypothetical protein